MPATDIPDIPGTDEPVPYTLTPKAHAFLDVVALAARYAGAAIIDGALFIETALGGFIADGAVGWACGQCGFAWFGPVPEDGLCPNCVAAYRRADC